MSYQWALGPFGSSWPGPHRLVLHIADDRITDVEQRAGYHARGCAARLQQIPLRQAVPLVNRICGVHGHHHALAWTLAQEALAQVAAPPRAQALRLLVAEGERVASHLQAAAILVQLLGLELLEQALVDLRETTLHGQQALTGHRLVHEFVLPGGVQHDLHSDEIRSLHGMLQEQEQALHLLIERLFRQRGLARRLAGRGRITAAQVAEHHVAGVVARASGVITDLRVDRPYAGYAHWKPRPVYRRGGDVYSRLFTSLLEAYESILLSQRILAALPQGLWRGDLLATLPPGTVTVEVEAPSGPLRYTLTSDGEALTEVSIRGAPLPSQALLRSLLMDEAAEDATLIWYSLLPCTACAEG